MSNIILSFLTLLFITCTASPVLAWDLWGRSAPLITLNGQEYQVEDYLNWWREWRDDDQPPSSPDAYIDWLLLSGEAEQMQLQDQPRYRKKVSIFLKVRSLMLLKKEEVDDKIVVADDEMLHSIYLRDYVPRRQLRTVTFRNDADLNQFLAAHDVCPTDSTEDILGTLPITKQEYILSSAVWERPNHLPEQILDLVQKTQGQRFSAPYSWHNTWQIIEIMTTEAASDEDFKQLRDALSARYLKQQRSHLTVQLMKQLREKYPVQLNKTLLEAIQYEGVPEGQAQETVLELLSFRITAAQLHRAAKKQYDTFAPQQKIKIVFERVLQQVVSGIISQNLSNTEALDRHYEQRPPFKSTYDFYCKNRLIKELEQQVILPEVQVTPAEIKQAYEQRKTQLSGPDLVEIVRGETTDADLATQLYEQLRQGASFTKIMTILGYKNFKSEKLPLQHLSISLQQRLNTLQPGQTDMIKDNNHFVFIQLVQKQHQEIVAFDVIKNALETQLKKSAFRKYKRTMVQQLRQRSTISINQQQWQRCLDTLQKGH